MKALYWPIFKFVCDCMALLPYENLQERAERLNDNVSNDNISSK